MYSHQGAIQLIESAFPCLTVGLHDDIVEDLLHPQMGVFSDLAQATIDSEDSRRWSLVTATFMELWLNCDDAVKNALNVSFLEHLVFDDLNFQPNWAFSAMPPAMRTAWEEMDSYNRRLHGG